MLLTLALPTPALAAETTSTAPLAEEPTATLDAPVVPPAAELEPPASKLPAPRVAPRDTFESDDTPASARILLSPDIWTAMARFGAAPLLQSRTFHAADDALPDAADQDWVRFNIDDAAVASGMSLLIEAVSADPRVDPVVELYGPFGAGKVPGATAVSELAAASDGDIATDSAARAGFDDDPWFASRGSSAALTLDPSGNGAGTYFVRVRPYWAGADEGFGGGAGGYTLRVKAGLATRIQGRDRYETAVRVSAERYGNGELVGGACVVASGTGFADALAGSTLAGALRGPLMLVAPNALPAPVAAEIRRLGVSTVYVLGGPRAVGAAPATAIDRLPGVSVVRIAGRDRYDTAIRVAETAQGVVRARGEELAPLAFVASGASFPDALSAAPMAAYNVAPVLLTPPRLADARVLGALQRLGVQDAVLVGGGAAVSADVQRAIEARLGGGRVLRIAGADRYQTSRAFAAWAVAGGADGRVGTAAAPQAIEALQPASVGLASGTSFADALTGGVLCGMRGAPVLLTAPAKLSPGVLGYVDSLGATFAKSYVFGGSAAVSQAAMDHFDLLTTAWWGPQ